jgi:hypothetical protein
MKALLQEVRHDPLLWLLAVVPAVFAGERLEPEAHTLLFVLSVFAIVPLAALLSHATESVAAKTGDTVGGLAGQDLQREAGWRRELGRRGPRARLERRTSTRLPFTGPQLPLLTWTRVSSLPGGPPALDQAD